MTSNLNERTSNKNKIAKNVFFNFVSQILTLVVPLITAPYLARILHETGNGQYSYASSIITYFTLFANLGFDIYGQKQIASKQGDKKAISVTFWEIFILKIIFTALSLIVLYSIGFSVGYGDKYTTLILILSLNVISVPLDIQFFFRGLEKFQLIAIRVIIVRAAYLICVFLFVKTENDLWVYALVTGLSTLLSNVVMWISLPRLIVKIKVGDMNLKQHLRPAFFIFLPTLCVSIYSVFDKTMIGLLAKNADYENGCYEQAYKINSVCVLFPCLLDSVFISRNADEYAKGGLKALESNIYFACNFAWLISVPLVVGNFVLVSNFSSWFFGDGYEIVPLLLIVMSFRFVTSGIGNVFSSQFFICIGKEKYCLITSIVTTLTNVALNAILIPNYGALGAAIATIVCECVHLIVLAIFAYRMHAFSMKKIALMSWKYVLASAIMFAPIYFMNKYIGYSVWSFFLIALTGVVIYFGFLLIIKDKIVWDGITNAKKKISSRIHK